MIDLTHAIPWQFEYEGVQYKNTCPMDSVLQLLYNMRTLKVLPEYVFNLDTALVDTLNLIGRGEFSLARHKWLSLSITELEYSDEVDVRENGAIVDLDGDTLTYTKSPLFR